MTDGPAPRRATTGPSSTDITPLVVPDATGWRSWLEQHEDDSDGVWLLLAKKGTTPTALTRPDALDEALCSGWTDAVARGYDDTTFLQRFTPRRPRSVWSERNVVRVADLVAEQRMRPRGQAEVDRARADGRWERAYQGSATAQVPDDLTAALATDPAAAEAFAALDRQNRYTVLHRLMTAATPQTRQRRLDRMVERLGQGWLPHP